MNLVKKLEILNKLIFNKCAGSKDIGVITSDKIIDNTPENMSNVCMSVYGIGYITSDSMVIQGTSSKTCSVSGRASNLSHKYKSKDFKVYIIDDNTVVGAADSYRTLEKVQSSMGVRDILDLDAVILNPNADSTPHNLIGQGESIRFKNLYMMCTKSSKEAFNQPCNITYVSTDNIYIDGVCSSVNINAINNKSVYLNGLDFATIDVSLCDGGKLTLCNLTNSFITITHIKKDDIVNISHLNGTVITFGRLDKTVVLSGLEHCRIRVQRKYLDKIKFDKLALINIQIYIDFLDEANLEEESDLDDIPVTDKNSKDTIRNADVMRFTGYYNVVESNCKLHDVKKSKLSMKLKMLNFNTFVYNDHLGIVVNDRDGLDNNIGKNKDIDIICFGASSESEKPSFTGYVQYNKNYEIDSNIIMLNKTNFLSKHAELKFNGALIVNDSNLRYDDFCYLIGIDSSYVYVDDMAEARLTVRPSDNADININNFNAGSISVVNTKKLHSVLFKGIETSVLKFENVNFNTVREGMVSFEKCESSIILCNNCKGKIRFSECSRILLFVNDDVYLIEESELVVGRAKNNRRIEYEVDTETGKIYNE